MVYFVVLFAIVAAAYLLKIILYFEAVCRENYHPIRVNFFFAPWITLLFFSDWSFIKGDHRTTAFPMAVRVNLFRGFKFSLAWWAYTFPMTGAAIATI
ncbi:putative S-type anion channel, voltage-dependent anion channel superfamily [Helianthus debilis subsp. tardiflorus]